MLTIAASPIFLVAYAFIASEKFKRVAVVSAGAAAMILIGATDSSSAFSQPRNGD